MKEFDELRATRCVTVAPLVAMLALASCGAAANSTDTARTPDAADTAAASEVADTAPEADGADTAPDIAVTRAYQCGPYALGVSAVHSDCVNSDYGPVDANGRVIEPPRRLEKAAYWEHLSSAVGESPSSVFTMPTIDDTRHRAYLTTGKDGARFANLFAYITVPTDLDGDGTPEPAGTELWNSNQFVDANGAVLAAKLDACAASSSAIIDSAGDAYIADCQYVWAIRTTNGKPIVKWRAKLPAMIDTSKNLSAPLITLQFSPERHFVGGVSSEGKVVFYARELEDRTGAAGAPDGFNDSQLKVGGATVEFYALPGLAAPSTEGSAPDNPLSAMFQACMFDNPSDGPANSDPLVAPEIAQKIMAGFVGGSATPVANTPAVYATGGKTYILIPGNLQANTRGDDTDVKLYKLVFDEATGSITEAAGYDGVLYDIGGSTTSVDLSPDAKTIIIGDNNDRMRAIDCATGTQTWEADVGSILGSFTVSQDAAYPDYRIYAFSGDAIRQISPEDGHEIAKWTFHEALATRFEAEALAPGTKLPRTIPVGLTGAISYSLKAMPASQIQVARDRAVVVFTLGYVPLGGDMPLVFPVGSFVATIHLRDDPSTVEVEVAGTISDAQLTSDVSEGLVSVDKDGNVYFSHVSINSSLTSCICRNDAQTADGEHNYTIPGEAELEDAMRAAGVKEFPLAPKGGVSVFRPRL